MAKGVKRVARESNRKSRYKTEGYIRSEQRKKLTRQINRIRNDIANGNINGVENISNANELLASLEQLKSETYINRKTGEYKFERKRLESTLEQVKNKREEIRVYEEILQKEPNKSLEQAVKKIDEKTQHRLNLIFQEKLNIASRSSSSTEIFSDISKAEAKAFYAATMDAWQGKDAKKRNHYIMEYYGTKSLEEAFNIVMNKKEVQEALSRVKEGELESEKQTSPDYITDLINALDVN